MEKPLWTPNSVSLALSPLKLFFQQVAKKHALEGDDFASFHRWSVENLEAFWEAVWEDAEVEVSEPHQSVLLSRAMPPERNLPNEVWFSGVRFNFAQQMLRHRGEKIALIAEAEGQERRTVSQEELYIQAARAQAAFKALGLKEGDRVAAFLPNTIEPVVAMLGASSLGAVWSSTSPDFGFQGVMDRFSQIAPRFLIATDGYQYGGKTHNTLEKVTQLAREIPSIEKVIIVPFGGTGSLPENSISWSDFLSLGGEKTPPMEFPGFPFDQPLYILYSSGTTGVPKCIVHGAGGALLKHHTEQKLHTSLGSNDTLFYFSTCGWMMWNWLVSALAQGTTLVLYDGNPAWPHEERLFQLAEENQVTVFGTSPKFLAMCQNNHLVPREKYPLPHLRTLLSTGAPLEKSQFHYVYEAIKSDLQLASISGGTDILGCFMLGNPLNPVFPGKIQGAALGVDLAAYDENGQAVVGEKGELVCRNPLPSMPIGFWNDPDQKKYKAAYFEDIPGVWRHGDYMTLYADGTVEVFGRSDTTLNPGGVRIGTAEIYRIVEALEEVTDSLVVGRNHGGDVEILLFVVLAQNQALDAALETKLRTEIRAQASPRHIPAHIRAIPEVPVTINGKKVELAAGKMLRGEEVKNKDALANPEALDIFTSMKF